MIKPSDAVARIIQQSWKHYKFRKELPTWIKQNYSEEIWMKLYGEKDYETLYNEISAKHAETRKKISAKRKELGGFHFYPAPPLNLRGKRLPRKFLKYANEYCEYTGEWKDNKPHGKGFMIWADGKTYDGYFAEGKRHGAGRMIKMKRQRLEYYDGEYKMNKKEGEGTKVFGNVNVFYEGEWMAGKRHGKGKERLATGELYEGKFKDDKMHGNGEFKWRNGELYRGQFVSSRREGKGDYMWKNGRIYTGMWSDNKMNGKGKFTWPDGSSYDGGYKNDKKEGHGTFRWGGVHKENGILMEKCVYEGQWANGKQNGKGKLTWGDGQGVLKDGKDGKDVKDSRENWTGPMLEGVWEEGKLIKTTKCTNGMLVDVDGKPVAKDDKPVA